jgi:hypothetical protein
VELRVCAPVHEDFVNTTQAIVLTNLGQHYTPMLAWIVWYLVMVVFGIGIRFAPAGHFRTIVDAHHAEIGVRVVCVRVVGVFE